MGNPRLQISNNWRAPWMAAAMVLLLPGIARGAPYFDLIARRDGVQLAGATRPIDEGLAPRLAAEGDRGIIVQPVRPHSDLVILPPPAKIEPPPVEPKAPDHGKAILLMPVRLAALDGQNGRLSGLSPKAPYEIVDPKANPDAVWNPQTLDVTADGAIIARNIQRSDLAGIIDRIAVLRWLQARPQKANQFIRILPDDRVHRKNSVVEIQLDGLAHRSLILVNVAGDGTVQVLYPRDVDPPVREDPQYRLQLQVTDPLGADEIVAISSAQPMPALTEALHRLDRARDPAKLTEAIETLGPVDLLLGSAGLFTAP